MEQYDVIIIGAGPCGLSCAIEAQHAGLNYLVLEKGNVVDSIRKYPVNMKFFSTSENLEIGDLPFPTVEIRPSRMEALKYYNKVVKKYDLNIQPFTEVISADKAMDHFMVDTNQGKYQCRYLVLATGYYDIPRELKVEGEDLPHVIKYYSEPFLYVNQKVVVVGGANSAIEAALDLYRNDADVTLIHKFDDLDRTAKYWIAPDLQNRIKKSEVKAHFNTVVTRIREQEIDVKNEKTGEEFTLEADFVFLMIGYRPDADLMRSMKINLTGEMLIPDLNPETYESNVADLYLAGSIIGGEETAKVFIENGKLHGEKIIKDIRQKISERS